MTVPYRVEGSDAICIPARAEDSDTGTVGDGTQVIDRSHPDWGRWDEYMRYLDTLNATP